MNDRHEGTTRDHDSPSSVEASLAAIIDRFGPSLLYEPERLRLLLTQDFPAQDRQIVQLLSALTAEVPQRLLAAHGEAGLGALLPLMVDRLGADPAFDRHAARWAVRTWASALALPTSGLGPGPATPTRSTTGASTLASVVTPLSTPRPAPVEPVPSSTGGASVEPAPPTLPPATADAPPDQPGPPDDLEATVILTAGDFWPATTPEDPSPGSTRPATVPPPPDVPPVTPPVTPTIAPPVAPPVVPKAAPIIVSSIRTPPPEPPSARVPATARFEEPEPPAPLPWWAAEASSADVSGIPSVGARRLLRRIGAGLGVVAIVAAAVFLYFTLRPSRSDFSSDTATRPPVGSPSQARNEEPVAAMPNARTEGTVASAPSALPPAIVPRIDPAPPPVVRPIERDVLPLQGAAPAPDAIRIDPSPSVAPTTVEAVPVAPKAPAITRIAVPRIVSGKPFTVGVTASGRGSDVAAIERRNVDAAGRVESKIVVTPATALKRSASGALLLPFKPIDGSSQGTVELTVVDRAGVRSRPRRVDLRVAAAAARTGKATPPALAAKAAPAAPSSTAAKTPGACTRTTCGSVVAVRPVDAAWSAFEVIVRMDDRSIQATRQGQRFRVGARVRLVNNRYVPLP